MQKFQRRLTKFVAAVLAQLHNCEANANNNGKRLDYLKGSFDRHIGHPTLQLLRNAAPVARVDALIVYQQHLSVCFSLSTDNWSEFDTGRAGRIGRRATLSR